MKKRIFLLVLAVALILSLLVGCDAVGGKAYNVTFILGDGREPVSAEVEEGVALWEPQPISDELVFAGWFYDAEFTRPHLKTGVTADTTLYARFIESGVNTVTFVYGGDRPDATVIADGTVPEPMAPTREGFVFLGWTTPSGDPYDFEAPLTAPHTVIVAKWREASAGVVLTVYPENGSDPYTVSYAYGAVPTKPDTPNNGDLDFIGWYTDADCLDLFDFDAALTADAQAYARWSVDYTALANRVSAELLPAAVRVETSRNSYTNLVSRSLGSGIIYAERDGYYYLLTNAHVVEAQSGFNAPTYKVFDSYDNEYAAQCLAISEEYDLAVLRFAKGEKALSCVSFASADPEVGEILVSVGNPGKLHNSVTYGKVTKYANVNLVEVSVGWHDAPIADGSSGGGVFNTDMELVGINFAAATYGDGSFHAAAFIQRSLVAVFLTENNLVF